MILRMMTLAIGLILVGGPIADRGPADALARASVGAIHSADTPYRGARLYLTPPRVMPGARIRVVAHLRGLPPGVAIELQIAAPAPATVTLFDLHTHATSVGTVDRPLVFGAPRFGAYVVFVNIGAYADPRSPLPGASLQATLLVAAAGPFLALPCATPLGSVVACRLAGYGFVPRESVSIVYRTSIQIGGIWREATTCRRVATTDGQGAFVRPVLSIAVARHASAYRVTVVARGTHGDDATTVVTTALQTPTQGR